LTTTIFWPSTFSSSAAVTRVTWSVEPPAAQGTIRLIGLVGFQFWACAAPASANANAAAAQRVRKVRACMSESFDGLELTVR
jgi:hypothetical protein